MQINRRDQKQSSRLLTIEWFFPLLPLLCLLLAGEGSVVLTQTHPAAPYVCRTGSITLRCQYDGVEGVDGVLWSTENDTATLFLSTIPGHTALPRTTTYQEVVVDSYTNLRERYHCEPLLMNATGLPSNEYETQIESEEVTISSLTMASRTATTLSVTWSAGYPKCYSFTVSHSTQDGSINVTQPGDSDTSHTLNSLQPGTTYRIEVETVRKGEGADGQRAKITGNFTTTDSTPKTNTAAIAGGVIGALLLTLFVIATIITMVIVIKRRRAVPGAKTVESSMPNTSNQENATNVSEDTKQNYAVLDWQKKDQLPIKAPDNEWFTVQYSEVRFDSTK